MAIVLACKRFRGVEAPQSMIEEIENLWDRPNNQKALEDDPEFTRGELEILVLYHTPPQSTESGKHPYDTKTICCGYDSDAPIHDV